MLRKVGKVNFKNRYTLQKIVSGVSIKLELETKKYDCHVLGNKSCIPARKYKVLNYIHIVYFVCRGADGPIFVPDFDKPYVRNKEDNYFTLEVLAAILEKLSAESGKIG